MENEHLWNIQGTYSSIDDHRQWCGLCSDECETEEEKHEGRCEWCLWMRRVAKKEGWDYEATRA